MPASLSKIGHIVLKVEDADSAVAFYCGVLGLKEVARRGPAQNAPHRISSARHASQPPATDGHRWWLTLNRPGDLARAGEQAGWQLRNLGI